MLDTLASMYEYIYLILIAIFSIPIIRKYEQVDGSQEICYSNNLVKELLLVAFLILFIGLRPVGAVAFTDMGAYVEAYRVFAKYPSSTSYTWDTDNIIFDNLVLFWGSHHLGQTNFFLLIASVYFVCSYVGIKRLFPTHTLPAYLTFLAAFSTFSYATNGMKAGMAASIFIMALGYMDKKALCILLALISLGFHHSMQLPIVALLIVYIIKEPKWFYYCWCLCLLLAITHITIFQTLFAGLTDEHGANYLIVKDSSVAQYIRFRPDFVLYSAFPVWIGYNFEIKRRQTSDIYSFLLHFYMVTNSIWMLCMYAAYNNRIAYLSWFIYPIVLIYPFLYVDDRETKNKYFSKTMKYHLLFSLLMIFVFYGILKL